jgi:hypothetical protein
LLVSLVYSTNDIIALKDITFKCFFGDNIKKEYELTNKEKLIMEQKIELYGNIILDNSNQTKL